MTEANEKSDLAKGVEAILKFWQEHKIFEQSLAKPSPRGEFVFYEGPPTANGRPGIHHLEARAFKDLIPRFKTMQGYHVRRKAGWDTHGLPVELEVEKELGLKSKKDIERYGLAAFNQKCRESVWKYLTEWQKFTERIGFWLDQADPYFTYTPDYIESVWSVIKQDADRSLLYKDYKVLPWCPRCGTALSSHELAQGYEEVTDPSVYVKFKVKNPQARGLPDNTFFVAWTTTPWTLPGNVALAVGEKIEYILQQNKNEFLITSRQFEFFAPRLAVGQASDSSGMASRVDKRVPVAQNQIAASQIIGLEYEPLFDFPELRNDKSHRVYAADFVSTAEGTGIVHTAVMYGQDDFELGTKIGLPKHHLVATDGTFIVGTPWAGKFVKDADREIIVDLKKRGLLFRQEKFEHEYPFCWRCQTPLIYYARDSWYIKMSALKEKLLAANQKINWLPAHIKNGRFGEWLAEVKDWAISRERYWGTPLPIWKLENQDQTIVIGSIAELKKHTKRSGNRYFVMRHGEAESNIRNVVNADDSNPMPLTADGQAAARQAAEDFKAKFGQVGYLIVSPLLRARETAKIVAAVLGVTAERVVVDDRLKEIQSGELNGQPIENYRRALPMYTTAVERFKRHPPGGESLADVRHRSGKVLYELEQKFKNQKFILITHEYVVWMLETAALGADAAGAITLRGLRPDFIDLAEIRPLDFIPLPHNADYELDLHQPFIDQVELVDENGLSLKRVPEVLDVWLDSGAMPLAQDRKILYPADYIAEAIDQTRGWFYTLLAIGALLDRGAPYKNVICLGHILDHQGKKMSKSVGNVVEPQLMIDKYGADALRFWMYTINQPGESKNFDEASVAEVIKKFINPLVNVLKFYELYGREQNPTVAAPIAKSVLDQWLLVLLTKAIVEVTEQLEHYRVTEAARALRDFVVQLSQWYLRRSRERFRGGDSAEAARATAVLGFTLRQLAKLLAPFMPFLAEQIHQKLRRPSEPASVHLTDWPEIKSLKLKTQSSKLMQEMIEVRRLASLGLEARARAGIKVRQPLARLTVRGPKNFSQELVALIKAEVNVEEVIWQMDLPAAVVLDTTITPELKLAGDRRELIRQIQDLRKQAGLRPGEPAVLRVSAKHAARALIAEQADVLRRTTNLKEIKFVDLLNGELSLSH